MEDNYGRLVKKAANSMSKSMDALGRPDELTGVQMSIIDFLANQTPPVLQRDIEAEFNIQRSTATVTLQRMEKRGLVTRSTNSGDARQKELHLTAKATALSAQVAAHITADEAAITAAFTPEERATFVRILHYVIAHEEGTDHD